VGTGFVNKVLIIKNENTLLKLPYSEEAPQGRSPEDLFKTRRFLYRHTHQERTPPTQLV